MGNYEDLPQLENAVREHLANRKRRSVEAETKDRLFAALVEKFQFPVPESLVQDQIDARLERGLRALAAQGMDPDQMRKARFQPPAGERSGTRRSPRSSPTFCSTGSLIKKGLPSARKSWTGSYNWLHFSHANPTRLSASV